MKAFEENRLFLDRLRWARTNAQSRELNFIHHRKIVTAKDHKEERGSEQHKLPFYIQTETMFSFEIMLKTDVKNDV